MKGRSLEYPLPDERGLVRFRPSVVAHLWRHRQSRLWRSESGGQLFATVSDQLVEIVEATGPRRSDCRSLFCYVPDREAERVEIRERFAEGLHFVGDWHSHRQRHPLPSTTDVESMVDMVRRSDHSLAGFLLVIVGTTKFPAGLHVSFHTEHNFQNLTPALDATSYDQTGPHPARRARMS